MPPVERDDRQDRERMKAVELAVGQIEKQFGKGSIMRLGQKGAIQPIDAIPTGAISIDYALGIGGVPRGRVIEIFGPESSGKTTLALQVIAEAQKLGGMAAFVDAEHALDAAYAQKLGVDLDNLLVSQPDNGEQALEIVEVLIRSNGVDVVVVDSVAALVPKAEIEGEMGEAQMGLQARLMSQALRKLTGAVSKSKTCLIFINQLREKIGVMFGNPETTTGGRALKFYASVRMDIRRIASIKDGDVGRRRPHAREGGQEQGGAALPRGGVRRDVRRGDLEDGRSARPGGRQAHRREERRLVRVRRRAARPGPREREAVPEGQPGCLCGDRRARPQGARAHQGNGDRIRLTFGATFGNQGVGIRAVWTTIPFRASSKEACATSLLLSSRSFRPSPAGRRPRQTSTAPGPPSSEGATCSCRCAPPRRRNGTATNGAATGARVRPSRRTSSPDCPSTTNG